MSTTPATPTEKKTIAKTATKAAAATKPAVRKVAARKTAVGPHLVPALTHEQIAHRAYEIWANRGYTHGANVQDWWQAEQDLKRA